ADDPVDDPVGAGQVAEIGGGTVGLDDAGEVDQPVSVDAVGGAVGDAGAGKDVVVGDGELAEAASDAEVDERPVGDGGAVGRHRGRDVLRAAGPERTRGRRGGGGGVGGRRGGRGDGEAAGEAA